jgi:hypothetical protein
MSGVFRAVCVSMRLIGFPRKTVQRRRVCCFAALLPHKHVTKQTSVKRCPAIGWRLQTVGTRRTGIGANVWNLKSTATSYADHRKIRQIDLYQKLRWREDSLIAQICEFANCAESRQQFS